MTDIGLYQPKHFGGVDQLWRKVFPDDSQRNQAANAIPLKLRENDNLFFVAEASDGSVVGTIMAGWDGHRGWLYSVAVDPDQQRSGVGRKLVERAIEALSNRGCNKLNLQIREVTSFYQKLGFEIEPRTSMGREI